MNLRTRQVNTRTGEIAARWLRSGPSSGCGSSSTTEALVIYAVWYSPLFCLFSLFPVRAPSNVWRVFGHLNEKEREKEGGGSEERKEERIEGRRKTERQEKERHTDPTVWSSGHHRELEAARPTNGRGVYQHSGFFFFFLLCHENKNEKSCHLFSVLPTIFLPSGKEN